MSRGPLGAAPSLAGLLGSPPEAVSERLGPPDVERRAGGDRWLVYRRSDLTLRIRFRGTKPGQGGGVVEGERVASWTVSLARGRPTLREAAGPFGLWPACAPDARAGEAEPLLRRPLPAPHGDAVHSLTATVRGGLIVGLAGFDEPPDWDLGGAPRDRRETTG